MKSLLLVLAVVLGQFVLAAQDIRKSKASAVRSSKPLTKEESAKVIDVAIRRAVKFGPERRGGQNIREAFFKKFDKNGDGKLDGNEIPSGEQLQEFSRPQLGELTKADLEKVTELHLVSKRLTSVKGLEKLTQLKTLNLQSNKLTDVKGLEKLTQLKTLSLARNKLTDVKGLEKLTKLTELDLGNNQLTEVPKELEKLTQLTVLSLRNNKLTDVKGLEKLTQLEDLNLVSNLALADFNGLEKLTQLKYLSVPGRVFPSRNVPPPKGGWPRGLEMAYRIGDLRKALPKCFFHHGRRRSEVFGRDRETGLLLDRGVIDRLKKQREDKQVAP